MVYWFLYQFTKQIDLYIFFVASRRLHTRCYRDWSSDVCSSDLRVAVAVLLGHHALTGTHMWPTLHAMLAYRPMGHAAPQHGYRHSVSVAGIVTDDQGRVLLGRKSAVEGKGAARVRRAAA